MNTNKPKYNLTQEGQFIIENYNFSKPFANFFPGIAGPFGIPIWTFYVNRGQAISSFGTKDKDHAILEFFPANKAWQMTPLQGFRSFLKVYSGKKDKIYEPFNCGPLNLGYELTNRMSITSYDLKLEEENLTLGIKTTVEYFTIPNDNFGALVRIVTVKNTGKTAKSLQFIDGLPQVVPFGTNNFCLKKMSRTIEAWMKVENLDNGVPFYKLAVDPADRPEVIHIEEGNFYLGFHFDNKKPEIIKPIINPDSIFDSITDFTFPYRFAQNKKFRPPKEESINSKTPCGFLFSDINLKPSGEKIFYSVIGYMLNQDILNSSLKRITDPAYLTRKRQENKITIEELQQNINTQSSSREFDLYAKQTYLDNILRGGYPLTFSSSPQSGSDKKVFYLYSRKHGDLERDYNKFLIQPTYFSQGNGNYRDVNQNRRSDIWFNPDINEENIIAFMNLLQTDGFNPLIVKGATFSLKGAAIIKEIFRDVTAQENIEKISNFMSKPFTPGELILFFEKNKIKIADYDELLNLLLPYCDKNQEAETTGEGFWTDHWIYNLDLIESYLSLYPENLKPLFFEKRLFTFFDNFETVKPRSEKYLLYNGLPKQLHSIYSDSAKKEMIRKRKEFPHTVRKQYGEGEIYRTDLLNKLLCVAANKMASLDPFGTGIEMEADKPNWFDSLNGLPALFGSSLCETLELKRLILLIKNTLLETRIENISLNDDVYNLLRGLDNLTREYFENGYSDKDYLFWDKTHSLREEYLTKTRFGLSGNELEKSAGELNAILDNFLKKLESGIIKALDKQNVYSAYFINEVSEYQSLENKFIKPLKFVQKKLPLFLESQVHALKIIDDAKKARDLYEAVKKSRLYDKELKMYKVTAPLSDMPEEIGRCRIFVPGWLENESIWLHMEYKYLLEILRSGLYEEFYKEFKDTLIPFQKPAKYGRSILENSSFLVSSAFPEEDMRGRGFVARLSGSTAEFIQIWLIMNLGKNPFVLDEQKQLNLKFTPALAGWLFDRKGSYSFNFLGKILVTYHNPSGKNTFGKKASSIKTISFNDKEGNPVEINSDTIPLPYSLQIRNREINSVDVYLE